MQDATDRSAKLRQIVAEKRKYRFFWNCQLEKGWMMKSFTVDSTVRGAQKKKPGSR
jgi:hypothetical protein